MYLPPREPALRSGRIVLFPLTAYDLELWIGDRCRLAETLSAEPALQRPGRLTTKVLQRKIEQIRHSPRHWLWNTYWAITYVEPDHPIVVGTLGFKGLQRSRREAEIGYAVEPPYRGRGLMREALTLLLEWAEKEGAVSRILARTDSANQGSIRVLQACDFALESSTGHQLLWVRSLRGAQKR
jgi:RimJ/RimL family protein N-acetyltransferase